MRKLVGLGLIIFTFSLPSLCFGQFYFSLGMGWVTNNASNNKDISSLSGLDVSGTVGLKVLDTLAPELFIKYYNFSQKKKRVSEGNLTSDMDNSLYGFGLRLWADELFTFKGGMVFHDISSEVKINGTNYPTRSVSGTDYGIYGGMGPNFSLGDVMDVYMDGTFYTALHYDIFFFEIEGGVRYRF